MTQRDAYNLGKQEGECIASWQELPEPGQSIPKELDWFGYDKVNRHNALEVFLLYCSEAEENARQYSPFEFTAKEFNDSRNPDEVWAKYEAGLQRGFVMNYRKRTKRPF